MTLNATEVEILTLASVIERTDDSDEHGDMLHTVLAATDPDELRRMVLGLSGICLGLMRDISLSEGGDPDASIANWLRSRYLEATT